MAPQAPDFALFIERGVDLWDFFGLAGFVRLGLVVEVGLAAEVDPEGAEVEAVAAVGADLLEGREELLLGRGPRVGRERRGVGRADLDRPVALQPRRRRDQLA